MGSNAKTRQKKIAKKRMKRKKAGRSLTRGAQLEISPSRCAELPIHECLMAAGMFDVGLGNVLIARRGPNGMMLVGVFLVDVYCLGVKDVLLHTVSEYEYESVHKPRLLGSAGELGYESLEPSCAKKLVEGAVLYAKSLGLSPHRDYAKAKRILAGIDSESCPVEYTYGQDGKPFYVQGPNESSARVKRILFQLERRCGEENYDFLLATPWGSG